MPQGYQFTITLEGLKELSEKLDAEKLIAEPLQDFFQAAGLVALNIAMEEAPVDLGDLRRAHTLMIDPSPLPLWGKVIVNKFYAEYVHDGTLPHPVPIWAIQPWALRHNINVYAVAAKIRKFGTKANPWMDRATVQARPRILNLWDKVLSKAVKKWQS